MFHVFRLHYSVRVPDLIDLNGVPPEDGQISHYRPIGFFSGPTFRFLCAVMRKRGGRSFILFV